MIIKSLIYWFFSHHYFSRLWLFGIIAVLISCHTPDSKERDTYGCEEQPSVLPISELTFPIRYDIVKLQRMINHEIGKDLLSKWVAVNKRDSLYLEIIKEGDLTLEWEPPYFRCSLPLLIKGRLKKRMLGMKAEMKNPIEARLKIYFSSKTGITPEWHIKTATSLDHIEWIKEPEVSIGFININLKNKVEKIIYEQEEEMVAHFDQATYEELTFDVDIKKIWEDLQRPLIINRKKNMPVWLHPQIKNFSADIHRRHKHQLEVIIHVSAYLETFTAFYYHEKPIKQLPSFERKEDIKEGLHATMKSTIAFEDIHKLFNNTLKDKLFEVKDREIKIRHFDIYTDGKQVCIDVDIDGEIKGELHLKGMFRYDSDAKHISIRSFEFSFDADSKVDQGLIYLMQEKIKHEMEKHLDFDITPLIRELPWMIYKGIEKGRTGDKIDVFIRELDILSIKEKHICDGVEFVFELKGKGAVDLEKIN